MILAHPQGLTWLPENTVDAQRGRTIHQLEIRQTKLACAPGCLHLQLRPPRNTVLILRQLNQTCVQVAVH